jgi:hypothetical protein
MLLKKYKPRMAPAAVIARDCCKRMNLMLLEWKPRTFKVAIYIRFSNVLEIDQSVHELYLHFISGRNLDCTIKTHYHKPHMDNQYIKITHFFLLPFEKKELFIK